MKYARKLIKTRPKVRYEPQPWRDPRLSDEQARVVYDKIMYPADPNAVIPTLTETQMYYPVAVTDPNIPAGVPLPYRLRGWRKNQHYLGKIKKGRRWVGVSRVPDGWDIAIGELRARWEAEDWPLDSWHEFRQDDRNYVDPYDVYDPRNPRNPKNAESRDRLFAKFPGKFPAGDPQLRDPYY
jgi:hypothetical protein